MKATTLLISAALILGPVALEAQAFEGTIVAVMSAGGNQIEMEQHSRGRMLRQNMTMAGNSMSVITNGESGKVIMLMHSQKMWMDMAAMTQMAARMGRGAKESTEPLKEIPPIERTDRVETIAGHECRHFLMDSPNGQIDLCAATGMGFVMPGGVPAMGGMGRPAQGPSMPNLPNADLWMKAFSDGFFVLKMEARTPEGSVSWVARSVERKAVPEEQFRPPAGYNEMKMPGGR